MKPQKCHKMSDTNTMEWGRKVMLLNIFLTGMLLLALLVQVNGRTKQKSVTGLNARQGCPVFFAKLQKKEPVTIVYFGGSITNHAGYRVFSEAWFKTQYPESKITAVNAGIGGTGSDLGVFRMDQDVLEFNPDLVFVEFAVNDAGTDSLVICHSMEGIVCKIKSHNPAIDICFLYTLNQGMLDDLQKGRLYKSMRYMENIASYYNIPSINFAPDVIRLINQDSLVFKGDKGVDYAGKMIFSNDGTHPTFDCGHKIYTKTLTQSFLSMGKMKGSKTVTKLRKPLYPGNYERAKSVSVSAFRKSAGWKVVPAYDKIYKYYQGSSKVFQDLIVSDSPDDFIEIKFKGSIAGVFDVIGPSSGDFTYQIDQAAKQSVRRFDVYCGNVFRSNYKLFPMLKEGTHTIIIRPDNTPFDKLAIYGSKPTQIKEGAYYQGYNTYIGNILLIGEVVK
ncbi:MAG: SGNH/GDSL hydrolase family protein [Prolixibacteraceae bacterium]